MVWALAGRICDKYDNLWAIINWLSLLKNDVKSTEISVDSSDFL